MQKKWKQKILKKRFVHFSLWLQNKIDPRKIGLTLEQNLVENSKNFAKLKEFKLPLQRVRLRLHLLNVRYDPWKVYFTVTWKILDASAELRSQSKRKQKFDQFFPNKFLSGLVKIVWCTLMSLSKNGFQLIFLRSWKERSVYEFLISGEEKWWFFVPVYLHW